MPGNDEIKPDMVPQGSLNHIAVEPTLHDSIIMAQLHDECIKIIKEKLSQGEAKYKCFRVDHRGILWFESRLVVPKDHQLRKQILDEAHHRSFRFIRVVQKCTKILNKISGGLE